MLPATLPCRSGVIVEFKGSHHLARVDEFGLWLWVGEDDNEDSAKMPIAVGPR
jgi:hypothetical protein